MKEDRKIIHIGVNFVFAPQPLLDRQKNLEFQKALADAGVDVARTSFQQNKLELQVQEGSSILTATVVLPGPQVGQLLLVAPAPGTFEIFLKRTDAIVKAFERTWPAQRQIIAADATIRQLHETTGVHAFKELWESRLKQADNSLKAFGRPVLGGGLRFVMPPVASDSQPVTIEVKIESFLQDSKNFFLETQFAWPQPTAKPANLDPENRLRQLDSYIKDHVIPFIMAK